MHRAHKIFFLSLPVLCTAIIAAAQNYHALQGSSYAGSMGVADNPASIVNTPYPWDITLFSVQAENSTNAVSIHHYSFLSSPKSAMVKINEGNYARYDAVDFNIHLLNVRLAFNRRQNIAFGFNLRGYGRVKTNTYNYRDSLPMLNDFFTINQGNPPFAGKLASSAWIEIFGTYSQTVWDDGITRINAGATIKTMRGISGAFAQLNNATVNSFFDDGKEEYTLDKGSLEYAYSANYDKWLANRTSQQNLHDFLNYSAGGIAADFGVECLLKKRTVHTVYDEDNYYNYNWKIGISLLDVGYNQYKYSRESRIASNAKSNISADDLQQKFMFVQDIPSFNDTMKTIVNKFSLPRGVFKIFNPVRFVINADKNLHNGFYVNGNISLNLNPRFNKKRLYTQDMNLITVTPRYETRRWGLYLPVQYNAERNFWIGAAAKIGPLIIGFHNLADVFTKNKAQNGGGYIALLIRPWQIITKVKWDKRLNCPENF